MATTNFQAWAAAGALAVLTFAGTNAEVRAELWHGFYSSSARANGTSGSSGHQIDDLACLGAIVEAQARYEIPDNLLLAIGIQEAGRRKDKITVWPWSANADGEGRFFRSKDEALDWVRALLASGINSIDVGCMQVNLRWHGDAFETLEQAFDPAINADYAAYFLASLYQRTGDWWAAAGNYHSATPNLQEKYLTSLARNHQVAKNEIDSILARVGSGARRLARNSRSRQPVLPKPPVLWSADRDESSADDGTDQYSIYSRQPIAPVLPGFKELF